MANSESRPSLTITRLFAVSPERLYSFWTQNEHLKHWCCPKGFTLTYTENDIRPGGRFRSRMRSPEGENFWLTGKYQELVPSQRIVFTHIWEDAAGHPGHETLVTVTFESKGEQTLLTLHQAFFPSEASCEGHREGWEETLDNLEHYQ